MSIVYNVAGCPILFLRCFTSNSITGNILQGGDDDYSLLQGEPCGYDPNSEDYSHLGPIIDRGSPPPPPPPVRHSSKQNSNNSSKLDVKFAMMLFTIVQLMPSALVMFVILQSYTVFLFCFPSRACVCRLSEHGIHTSCL